jgi:hypothetical protein
MTKSTLFDRLNQELEAFGKKAHAALDEGKVQIELLRMRRKRDGAARDLGLLVHRRERGGEVEPLRVDGLLQRLDELEAEIARLDRQLADQRQQRPAPAPVAQA